MTFKEKEKKNQNIAMKMLDSFHTFLSLLLFRF